MPAGSAVHAVGLHVVARSLAEGAIQRARAAAVAIARATRGRRARAAGARNGAAGHDVASAHGGAGGAAILAPGRSAGLAQRDARAATKALSGRAHAEPRGAHLSTGARALAGAAVPCVGLELGARPAAESVPFGAAGRRVEPAIHPGVGSFRHRRTGHVDLHTRRTDSATEGRPENHYTPSTHTHPFRIYNNREIAARAASWSPSAAPRAWPLRGGRLRPGPSSNRARTTVADDRGPGARRCRTHTVPPRLATETVPHHQIRRLAPISRRGSRRSQKGFNSSRDVRRSEAGAIGPRSGSGHCVFRLFGVALVLCAIGGAADASAQSVVPRVRLEYVRGSGAERCPDASRLRDAVAAQLGRPAFAESGSAVVNAVVARAEGRWIASLTARDPDGNIVGTRELRVPSADCRDVTDALAFALGLAVESLARRLVAPSVPVPPAVAPEPPAAVPAPTRQVLPLAVPMAPPAAVATPRSRPRWQVGVGVEGAAVAGVVPGVSAGFAVAVEARRAAWGAEFTAGYVVPGTASGSLAGSAATVDALRASVAPCVWISVLRLCVPCTVARVAGHGSGVANPADDAVPAVHLGLRADVTLGSFGGVSIRVAGGASAALVRAGFRLGGQTAWTESLVEGWGGVAVRYTFR